MILAPSRKALYNPASFLHLGGYACSRRGRPVRFWKLQKHAYRQSVNAPWARRQEGQVQGSGPGWLAAKAGRLHPGVYNDAEKAEFGPAEGRQGAAALACNRER